MLQGGEEEEKKNFAPEHLLTLMYPDHLLKAVEGTYDTFIAVTRPINILTYPFHVKWIYVLV